MIKNFLGFSIFLASLSFISCDSNEYAGYDADNAESPYVPRENVRMVKSVKSVNRIGGRDYSWEHTFEYDKHNRIKEINLSVIHHRKVASEYYLCHITSKACYYYLDKTLDVCYDIKWEYPEAPSENTSVKGKDEGIFGSSGNLLKISSLDLEYSGNTLVKAYSDGGRRYEITRTRDCVNGFKLYDDYLDTIISDKGDIYKYAYDKNNTNFDFSGYFGYWGIESEIPYNSIPYYASYQLAAFGMMGSTSPYLPLGKAVTADDGSVAYGKWSFDDKGYPVEFMDSDGRRTVVTYIE